MNIWFYLNTTVIIIATWQLVQRYPSITLHVIIGFIGLGFFLFNWTRHAVFSTIRETSDRKLKIRLAIMSKKIVPFHRWIGNIALLIILGHAYLVLNLFGFYWSNPKMISGVLALLFLVAMVTTGWMRLIKPTVKKRKAHIYIGMTLFFLITLHIIIG
ncbi:hypothetical protein SAMN05216389_1207 [Oceanobacillus limi]|uniref:Ferric reductase like transmembrane component n=1 Tax=Oceanobacillus limi TaxID=930131 RepID=A0A1I0G8I8_9BACI|nr:hypothetical protein [Oceanobacillus limi]SET67309.1 hypothetical protein SAMN05216389_1207 [Oceanobacillus limi]